MRKIQPHSLPPLRLIIVLFISVAVLGSSGCAVLEFKPPDTGYQDKLGQVALIALEQPPTLKFEGYAKSKGSGAARGAGGTFASCLSGLGSGGCSGEFCGAVLVLALGICGVAGIVGGVVGAAEAPAAEQARTSEQVLTQAMAAEPFQKLLRDHLEAVAQGRGTRLLHLPLDQAREAAATKDYRTLANLGMDTVLETALTEAGIWGAGINDPVSPYLQARVRLVSTRDNGELFGASYLFTGQRRKLDEWLAEGEGKEGAKGGNALLAELQRGYPALAAHVHDQVFQLYPFPDRHVHSGGGLFSTAFGLAPLSPTTRGQLSGSTLMGGVLEWTAVESLSPTLKWQAFPRAGDKDAAPADMARASHVTYELLIARERHMAPAELVYRREGLEAAEHTLEQALEPGRRYFWTIRARFELDGRYRVSEWGSTGLFAGTSLVPPSRLAYRFRTPEEP